MNWLRENWFWLVVIALFLWLHMKGHGAHGGHGGHGGRREHGGGGDDRGAEPPDADDRQVSRKRGGPHDQH